MPDVLLTRVIEATMWNIGIVHMLRSLLLRNVLIWRVTCVRMKQHHSARAMRWLMMRN